jgi:hypothetical protein
MNGSVHIVLRCPPHQWRQVFKCAKPGMSIRLRKLIGVLALFALVSVWALLAMAIAQFPAIFNNRLIAGLYYFLAGIGWVLPAMPLIKWMSKA